MLTPLGVALQLPLALFVILGSPSFWSLQGRFGSTLTGPLLEPLADFAL